MATTLPQLTELLETLDLATGSVNETPAPWVKHYPPCIPAKLHYPEVPAWGLLERSAKAYPDRLACIYYKQRVTYRELSESAHRFAAALARMGVRPGDRVGILLPNTPEFLVALNGTWMAGAAAVAISPLMVAEEVSDLLTATDCKVVISLDILAPLVLNAKKQPEHLIVTTIADRLPLWQRALYNVAVLTKLGIRKKSGGPKRYDYNREISQSNPSFTPFEPSSLDAPAFILATGGTTGCPKAVVLSHKNLVANATQLHHWAGAAMGRDSILAIVPFFHSYGLSTCAMSGMAMAATLVMHHRFVPKIVVKLIEEHEPTGFPAVPAMLVALNHLLKKRPIQYRALRYCTCGGAPLDPSIAAEFASLTGAMVVEGFGLSEASPVTHSGPLDGTARPGTMGLPLPDTLARIVDADTGLTTLPPGEVGELIVKGPQVMVGYWNNPEATANTIRNGWLYTGDLAVCDEDGFFRIVDRKKDLIITSGFNVYPTDVEVVLRGCPGVKDLAIVGVPDGEKGELVKAVIVPEPGFDRHVFEEFAKEHLSKHKRPVLIDMVEGDLPRNFLGKVYRRKLREPANAPQIAVPITVGGLAPAAAMAE
ncbi:MAG: AMP-binding protein [Planctomycetaceae bacterium]